MRIHGIIRGLKTISSNNQKIFIILAFIITVCPLLYFQKVWMDEVYSMNTTSEGIAKAYKGAVTLEAQPPLYFITLAVWRLINPSELWARFLSFILIFISLLLIPKISKRYLPGLNANWLLLIYAFNPFIFWAATEIRCYSMVILFSAMLLLLFYDTYILEKPKYRLLYILIALCAIFTQYYLSFLLLANGITLLISKGPKRFFKYSIDMVIPLLSLILFFDHIQSNYADQVLPFSYHLSLLGSINFISGILQSYIYSIDSFNLSITYRFIYRVTFLILLLLLYKKFAGNFKLKELVKQNLTLSISFILITIFIILFDIMRYDMILKRHTSIIYLPLLVSLLFIIKTIFKVNSYKIILLFLSVNVFAICFSKYLYRDRDYDVINYITSNESGDQPIFIYPNELAMDFGYDYKGRNKVIAIPKAISTNTTYNNKSWFIRDTLQLDSLFTDCKGKGVCWLVTLKKAKHIYGLDYKNTILDYYVKKNFNVDTAFKNNEYVIRKIQRL